MSISDLKNKIFFPDAIDFMFSFENLSLETGPGHHPFRKVYTQSPEKATKFLNQYLPTGIFSPMVNKESNKTTITLSPPEKQKLEELQRSFPDVPYLELACFQKFYKDKYSNFAPSITLRGAYGQQCLSTNNIAALGADVASEQRVNLFIGASETFECSLRPISNSDSLDDWVELAEVPFNEMGNNINGSVEGAHYPLITKRAKHLCSSIIEQGAQIENLFIFAGWHNLIYNENTPDAWENYANQLIDLAPRVCFFQITSPVLEQNFNAIKNFCDEGYPFWGYMDCSQENYNTLKKKIVEYNEWLSQFCDQHGKVLMVPTHSFLEYDANQIKHYFRDVNHFAANNILRQSLTKGLNTFLMAQSEFFAPDIGSVSEYIYPTF